MRTQKLLHSESERARVNVNELRRNERDGACSRRHESSYAKRRQLDSAGKVTLKAAAGPCWRGEALFRKRGIFETNQSSLRLDRTTTLGILLPSSPKVLVLCKVEPHSQSQCVFILSLSITLLYLFFSFLFTCTSFPIIPFSSPTDLCLYLMF